MRGDAALLGAAQGAQENLPVIGVVAIFPFKAI